MDEIMRKPVHYAATCSGTGPLKYLLSKGVDPREGDREKNTPLILAARYGRHANLKVLIDHLGAEAPIIN
jgi:ankyrin repeat protein